jgi:methyl-accepting chemotaxis protein
MGEIAKSTAGSISELRQSATKHWDETGAAIERLSNVTKDLARKIGDQSLKLDEHAATVSEQQKTISTLQIGRGKLAFLASIGVLAITAIGWAIEAGIQWFAEHVLRMKFGA